MNLLLDTHIALWAITDSPRLSTRARELIGAQRAVVWVSVVSLWEIAIKHALARGDMPVSAREAAGHFSASGFRLLPIEVEHALGVESLPALHADPFDRLLVAQAREVPLRLLTHDETVARYSDAIIRA
ncbi:MAG: twitching motility protein PilT [Rubrivivax sp. SCN 71-131]|nr:MAG: twitching motility protein PilT [Rubrivivax sp. SCN 71-131]